MVKENKYVAVEVEIKSRISQHLEIKVYNKMQCSAEEIAEKKRQAIERLEEKKRNSAAANNNNSTSPDASTKSSSNFYGNAIANKVSELNEYENKIKNTSNQATTNNRILSQPYPHRNTNKNEIHWTNAFDLMKKSVNSNSASCTCSMISTDRFQVEVAGFHKQLNDVFKTIPSRNFGKNIFLYLSFLL